MANDYDLIIIGGGHNGLVTAAYMARAGRKVLVLEKRPVLGGACVTEETFPGYKVSTFSYVNSLFRPDIIRDLSSMITVLKCSSAVLKLYPFADGLFGTRPRCPDDP